MQLFNFDILNTIWIIIAIGTFILLFYVTAPFGRHTSAQWGILISNKLAWFFMELPALWVFPLFFVFNYSNMNISVSIIIALWVIHYFNRAFIFPFRLKTQHKKMPLLLAIFAFIFNIINGSLLGWDMAVVNPIKSEIFTSPSFTLGICIFFIGLFINWTSDSYLISLRDNNTGYMIPRKGLFNWISCPNHFGEIIEWIGFAICTWHYSALGFAIWTFANLSPRAWSHHKWYYDYFKNDYPKTRKAIVPFLW